MSRPVAGRRFDGLWAEDGSMLPLVGALLFTAIVVVALLADIAMLQVTYRSTASQADRIAEGAAAMLSGPGVRLDGEVTLDPQAARARAVELATAEGIGDGELTIEAGADRVCIALSRLHHPNGLRAVGASAVEVRVRSCAVPGAG